MVVKTHQRTKVTSSNKSISVNNNFNKKHLKVKNLPLGSRIRVGDSFVTPQTLKVRMSEIKASAKYREGRNNIKSKLKSVRYKRGSNVKVSIS
jgi:hypothetical protein